MAYWLREVAGWVLIAIGLYAFWLAYDFLLMKRIFQAGPMSFIGFIVFRGGIHLLKVSVAAQAARHIPEVLQQTAKKSPVRLINRPIGPTAVKEVIPGPNTAKPTLNRPVSPGGRPN